ncbi:GxxExxY protein [Hymenobacter luteus]|uniref:GxxExxY protein n=2 Tax=Hymenobacter TaxID=89966 RepID=A0A7W9T3W9_9BACT|nr:MULTISPECIES: GxxExxY protein [Hymenobacter]MBB4603315.1 GxxExxY protein [Hymenobacter latericoloratus]MBB6061127.1 GxxExxY protein [Hymenobacter luteus]
MHENDISYLIRKASFDVHTVLGPGLLESVYEAALIFELQQAGLRVRSQVPLPMLYKTQRMEVGFRLDLLVEEKVIVEIKSVDTLLDVHHKQLLTYLKLSGLKLGLLINFNVSHVKEGIVRKVNGLT